MSDVLSQAEVESLLAALEPGQNSTPLAKGASQPSHKSAGAVASPLRPLNISVYDFKRPERVSKEQMRAFQAMHESFSRELGAALSGMLRTIVEVKLISVDQLTYSEFVFSLENPTCFNLLRSTGLDGHMILDLNPSIIFPIVDRLLGGGRETREWQLHRPLTEIELRLVSRITTIALAGLEKAWGNLCVLGLELTQVESNPQLIQIVPPNEVIVLISFELAMGDQRGIMNLCIPYNTIEPLAGKLSSDTWSAYTKRTVDNTQRSSLEQGLGLSRVSMRVEIAQTTVTAGDLSDLAIGDLIMTEKGTEQGVEVSIEGRPVFRAHPGILKGKKAIRITNRTERRVAPGESSAEM